MPGHTTSPEPGHLLIGNCRMTVRRLDLVGPFKLLLAEPPRLHQLQLLASFMVSHGDALLRLDLCTPPRGRPKALSSSPSDRGLRRLRRPPNSATVETRAPQVALP
jgi:hypothetical protein